MPRATVHPIADEDLTDVCQFLHDQLDASRPVEAWEKAFQNSWMPAKPNHGFLLRDQDKVVGVIGAIYSEQRIRGQVEQFCNITSWCVLDAYRLQSMQLAITLTSQEGYHYTDLSPTEVVAGVLRFLKFKPLDANPTLMANLPWPGLGRDGSRVIVDPEELERELPPEAARIYQDHRDYPGLYHLAVGRAGQFCYLIYKRRTIRGLPCAMIIGLTDAALFLRYRWMLGHHFLMKLRMPITGIETRLLPAKPPISLQRHGYRSKMYRSETLDASDITSFYSEAIALDL